MPDINFDCPSCGQNLEAPEDMAGDVVDCPSCQKPLKVPKPAVPPPKPVVPPQKPAFSPPRPAASEPKAGAPQRPAGAGGSGPAFSSDAMKKATAAAEKAVSNKCPECGADMKEDAVICLKCGFNRKLGKKMSTDFS